MYINLILPLFGLLKSDMQYNFFYKKTLSFLAKNVRVYRNKHRWVNINTNKTKLFEYKD